MKLAVIGSGYVGLVTGTCFSDLGNEVLCVDKDPEKLRLLSSGEIPFYEPELKEKIEKNRREDRLSFVGDLSLALSVSDIIFIAVGTPSTQEGGADLSAVFQVCQEIIGFLKTNLSSAKILVLKSTVPLGTAAQVRRLIAEQGLSERISVVSNPEFLREGTAVHDFFHPDRIVLGSDREEALEIMSQLYGPLYRIETPIVRCNSETAELSKYASNAFLATKISFINEMANLCEQSEADVSTVAKIMGMDKRIGRFFLHPGPGYGGSCFPKDTEALLHIGKTLGQKCNIVESVISVNQVQREKPFHVLSKLLNHELANKKIAILGLSFKPNTDDIRESSSLKVIKMILAAGGQVSAYDPEAMGNVKSIFPDIYFAEDAYDCCKESNALLLMTEWNLFRELDLKRIKTSMKTPIFLDFRNVYKPQELQKEGFCFYVIGKPKQY